MPADHLDDDAISDAIDGVAPPAPADAHLASCPSCQARRARMAEAARLVATPVPHLDADVARELVGRALAAPVVSLDEHRRHGRRLQTVPPPWLIAVAAALVLVLGIPALLRSTGGGSQDSLSAGVADRTSRTESVAEDGTAGSAGSAEGGLGTAAAALGPHLGTVDSDDAVVAGLRARFDGPQAAASAPLVVAEPTSRAAADSADDFDDDADAGARTAPPTTTPPLPPCSGQAQAATGSVANRLFYVAPATWQGGPVLVWVFTLAQPADDGLRRQAVLTTSGCDVVAAPRF